MPPPSTDQNDTDFSVLQDEVMRSHFLCLILLHFLMQEGQTQEAARDKNMGVYNSKKKKTIEVSWGQKDTVLVWSCQQLYLRSPFRNFYSSISALLTVILYTNTIHNLAAV